MNWFSITKSGGNDEQPSYCEYCLVNFKQYREMLNNICQSCGRPSRLTEKNKQPNLNLTSNNTPLSEDTRKAISMEIDYLVDDSLPNLDVRMKANSLAEANRLLFATDYKYKQQYETFRTHSSAKIKRVELD